MLEVKNLCAGYNGTPVLQELSFRASPGEITVILGPNGCGKSTLLKSLCGIVSPTGGEILLDGTSLHTLGQRELAKKMAYLMQSRQTPDITVGRLVLHGRFPHLSYPRRYGPKDHAIAHRAMEQLGILELKEREVCQLSGGQQQKVYLAMALAQEGEVLLLDEPNTYLDISCQRQLLQQVRSLKAAGKHILIVLHDLVQGLELADRVLLLSRGRLVGEGTAEEIYASGAIDEVFGIRLTRVEVKGVPRYVVTD